MERKPRVYWFKGNKKRKDILIFDAGAELGFIHVYELKESINASELKNQIEKYGSPMTWRITRFADAP